MRQIVRIGALFVGIVMLASCSQGDVENKATTAVADPQILLLNIKSGATEDTHAVTMALQLAGHALDDGREVVLFFNVRSVDIPTNGFSENLAFKDQPIKGLLKSLLARGAQAHVCPHCMMAMGIDSHDLIPGAQVTDRDKLFSRITPNTTVFTY